MTTFFSKNYQMTVNERIRHIIEALQLNNRTFAQAINVDPAVMHNIASEKGRQSKPSFEVIEKIMLSFENINPDYLIVGKGYVFRDDPTPKEESVTLNSTPSGTTDKKDTLEPSDNLNMMMVQFIKTQEEVVLGLKNMKTQLQEEVIPELKNMKVQLKVVNKEVDEIKKHQTDQAFQTNASPAKIPTVNYEYKMREEQREEASQITPVETVGGSTLYLSNLQKIAGPRNNNLREAEEFRKQKNALEAQKS